MHHYFTVILCLIPSVLSSALHTSGRWILDENDQRFKFRCVNWAGHAEVKIPEGLQHQPVDAITSWIAKNNFNCVRLTYSTDMAVNPNQTVQASFSEAAVLTDVDPTDMHDIFLQATEKNPWLATSTVIQAFGKVIESLQRQGIKVILDNHVSKASWCCSYNDGNGWFGDGTSQYQLINSRYFDVFDWLKGLNDMAVFAKDYPNVVAMSLRNELRALGDQNNNNDWYNYMSRGAKVVHEANPTILIAIGGVRSAGDLRFLNSNPLDTSEFANRTIWEFHSYQWSYLFLTSICPIFNGILGYYVGFLLQEDKPYTGPLWLSEFGVGQTGGPNHGLSNSDYGYLKCLVKFMTNNDADWAYWALQGSYYVRDSRLNDDESFGLLTRDWKDWRNPEFASLLGEMWNMTQTP